MLNQRTPAGTTDTRSYQCGRLWSYHRAEFYPYFKGDEKLKRESEQREEEHHQPNLELKVLTGCRINSSNLKQPLKLGAKQGSSRSRHLLATIQRHELEDRTLGESPENERVKTLTQRRSEAIPRELGPWHRARTSRNIGEKKKKEMGINSWREESEERTSWRKTGRLNGEPSRVPLSSCFNDGAPKKERRFFYSPPAALLCRCRTAAPGEVRGGCRSGQSGGASKSKQSRRILPLAGSGSGSACSGGQQKPAERGRRRISLPPFLSPLRESSFLAGSGTGRVASSSGQLTHAKQSPAVPGLAVCAVREKRVGCS
jgi:hypothetical protein